MCRRQSAAAVAASVRVGASWERFPLQSVDKSDLVYLFQSFKSFHPAQRNDTHTASYSDSYSTQSLQALADGSTLEVETEWLSRIRYK
jgi:hypothetical protein